MKRKLLILVSVVSLGLLMVSPVVFAYPVINETIVFGDGTGNGPGGEFTMTGVITYPNTFCVETGEYLSFGVPYIVAGYKAETGGTAWLYYNFVNGTLPDLTGVSGTSYGSAADADALQAAIWEFEGQSFGAQNNYWTLANGAPAGEVATALNSVVILNMVQNVIQTAGATAGQVNIQDVLGITQVPEPTTLLLLGLGLLGVGIVSRKK
jgi:hypothetical protein